MFTIFKGKGPDDRSMGNIYCETEGSEETSEQFIKQGGLQVSRKCLEMTDHRNEKWFFTMLHFLSNVASFSSLRQHFMRSEIINGLLKQCQCDEPISGVSTEFASLFGLQLFQINYTTKGWT